MIDLPALLSIVRDGGIIGLLVVVLYGGTTQMWVWGWAYRAVVEDRDEWKRLALDLLDVAHKATDSLPKGRR